MIQSFGITRKHVSAVMSVAGFAVVLSLPMTNTSAAAELLMFESKGCSWCAVWHKEIGAIYPNTSKDKMTPLREVDVHNPPVSVALSKTVVYSPTIVVAEDSREIGRITGYPGESFFWGC